jgi:hypothetical protein
MADSTLAALTAATAATGGLYYGTQTGADRKFTMTAAGATLAEAANAAAQVTALGVLPLAGGTLTGQLIQSTNGAASTSPLLVTGTVFTGGSGTTTTPLLNFLPTGTTAATGWSTSGTFIGINAASGFAGNFLQFKKNNTTLATLSNDGTLTLGNTISSPQMQTTVDNGYLQFGAKAYIQGSSTDGTLFIANNAGTGFTQLVFGGAATSSHPAIRRNSTTLQCKLGDNSAYAQFDALGYSVGGSAGASGTGTVISSITVTNGIITAITVA